jgi:hypothetical protein
MKIIKFFKQHFRYILKDTTKKVKKTLNLNEEVTIANLTYQKPNNALIEVIQSPKEIAVGSKLLYNGTNKVKVKAAGLLGIFPINFSIDDPMFSNTRNHKILDTLDGLKRIIKNDTKAEIIGTSTINDKEIYLIKVIASEKPDKEITHEIFGVDTTNFVVLLNEMYINDDLVSQYIVKDIKLNIDLPRNFFKL